MASQLPDILPEHSTLLALAPMQDVTDLPFIQLISRYGGADLFFTEYFRVHATSVLSRRILASIERNSTGRPIFAQLIGNDIPALVRTARELQNYPTAGIDLNLGCPAPVVYRKCAGGGLLREPQRIDAILGALRETITTRFTVKTRIGFESGDNFDDLLAIFSKHSLDLLTVHGRTVGEMYRSEVHYDLIARAVEKMPCPVLANGNVFSARKGIEVLAATGAKGLMIGRGAIRNPWIFRQFRELQAGVDPFVPTGRDVLKYVHELYHAVRPPGIKSPAHVQKIKKYLNYLGLGIEPTGAFLHAIRRTQTEGELFEICAQHLDHDAPMQLEPFPLALKERDVLAGCHF